MKTKKFQENKNKHIYPYPNNIKLNYNEQELFEEKLHLNLNQEKKEFNSLINNNNELNYLKEEEDDYDNYIYNLSLSKDKYFLDGIINNENNNLTKSLGYNDQLLFSSDKKKFLSNSINYTNINEENNHEINNKDINYLINNIQLFIQMNKQKKNNYIIDLQYNNNNNNNYIFNSIESSSFKTGKKLTNKFSKIFKEKKNNLNESSTMPVTHSRLISKPLKPLIGSYIHINTNNKNNKNIFDKFNQYYTNENIRYKNKNRILDITSLYEEKKLYGNSFISNLKNKKPILEEKYVFDSCGNQKFLCVKRLGENNNNNDISLKIINKKIKNNYDINYQNYANKNKKKINKRKGGLKTNERIVFYSPQISYKNVFSPNSKNCLGKLYKKLNNSNNLINSRSCIFKYLKNKVNNINNNKIINSENNNDIIKNNNIYNSVRNKNGLIYLNNNIENVKVDYSNKNNYKYHEIKLPEGKSFKNIKNIKNSISLDNMIKKYKMMIKNKNGKYIRFKQGSEVEKNN